VTRLFCSPYHASSALYPLIDHLVRAATIAHDDTAETKRDKLEALLEPALLASDDVALLAEFAFGSRQRRPIRRCRLIRRSRGGGPSRRCSDYLLATTRRTTGLLVWEDIHWIDPTSRALHDHLVERARSEALLLLVRQDPPAIRIGGAQAHAAIVDLARLDRIEATSAGARDQSFAALRRPSTRSSRAAMACRSSSRN